MSIAAYPGPMFRRRETFVRIVVFVVVFGMVAAVLAGLFAN